MTSTTRAIFLAVIGLILGTTSALAVVDEGLTEMVARKARRGTNTFYSGESGCTRQSGTFMYYDNTTKREVWKITDTPNRQSYVHLDLVWSPWSTSSGKWLYLYSRVGVGAACTGSALTDNSYDSLFFIKSDGSALHAAGDNVPFMYNDSTSYLNWSPAEDSAYYSVGRNEFYKNTFLGNKVYRSVVSDNDVGSDDYLTISNHVLSGRTNELQLDRAISPDGAKFLVMSDTIYLNETVYPLTIFPTESKAVDDNTGWLSPSIDTYWGTPDCAVVSGMHTGRNVHFTVQDNGAKWYWFEVAPMREDDGSAGIWGMGLTGSAADGAPLVVVDNTSPYDFGGEMTIVNAGPLGSRVEGRCVQSATEGRDPWCCDNNAATYCPPYLSHSVWDRWGRNVAFTDIGVTGIGVFNFADHTDGIHVTIPGSNSSRHNSWDGWTDWIATTPSATTDNTLAFVLKYNDNTSLTAVANTHIRETSGNGVYRTLPRVMQSPDGTKLAYHGDFLYDNACVSGQNSSCALDVYWAVAYYPYPPEIRSVAKTGDNVVVTFDFGENTANKRTYTTRGWPNETTDVPPAPREIKQFRLWTSTDNAAWTPRGLATYGNTGGTWTDNSWTINYAQTDNTTLYYAVTSQEHSGLESHTLSNRWSVTLAVGGAMTDNALAGAYPTAPGDNTAFYTTAPDNVATPTVTHCISGACAAKSPQPNTAGQYWVRWTIPADASSMTRYFNIYAADNAAPSISQTTRIASIAKSNFAGTTGDYVDWLGADDGSTQYVVTQVDYFGNESGSGVPAGVTLISPVPAATGGNFSATITWDNVAGGTSYKLYRSTSSPVAKTDTLVSASATSPYVDNNLVGNTTYYYGATTVNDAGEGDISPSVSATTTHRLSTVTTINGSVK